MQGREQEYIVFDDRKCKGKIHRAQTAIYGKRNAVIRPTWGIGTYGVCVCRPANVDRA